MWPNLRAFLVLLFFFFFPNKTQNALRITSKDVIQESMSYSSILGLYLGYAATPLSLFCSVGSAVHWLLESHWIWPIKPQASPVCIGNCKSVMIYNNKCTSETSLVSKKPHCNQVHGNGNTIGVNIWSEHRVIKYNWTNPVYWFH